MKPVLAAATISTLALAGIASAAPVLAEPRAYVASATYEVGRGLWSYRDAAYAAQGGNVVRYQRTSDAVVKTDSVATGVGTETPMYIAKDSLHGFIIGYNGVCMVDWTVHPGKLGRCVDLMPFGHGGFTGGLAMGRFLDVCTPGKGYALDTQGDSLHLVDSLVAPLGGLRCQIEGEVLHTIQASASGYALSKWMAKDLSRFQTQDLDSSAVGSFSWAAGQGAGLLALDTNGSLDRLKWGNISHGAAIAGIAMLKDRYKSATQSDSNIVFTNDSTIYLVRWTNSGNPLLAAKLSFDADLYGFPAVAVDGAYVWVRTPTGLLSLAIREQTAGIHGLESSRTSKIPGIAVHGRTLDFTPTSSGTARIVMPDGSVLADVLLEAGSAISWTSSRRGLHLVRLEDRTVSVMIP